MVQMSNRFVANMAVSCHVQVHHDQWMEATDLYSDAMNQMANAYGSHALPQAVVLLKNANTRA